MRSRPLLASQHASQAVVEADGAPSCLSRANSPWSFSVYRFSTAKISAPATNTAPAIREPRSSHRPIGSHSTLSSFVVVSLLNTRHHTPVIKRSANPEFALKDATFDFPIYLSLADRLGAIEIVVWDKDSMLRKEYLGEVALPLEVWFRDGNAFGFNDDENKVLSIVCLVSPPLMSHLHRSRRLCRSYPPEPRRSHPVRCKSNSGLSRPRTLVH